MAVEILAVPEEHLPEFITILRAGLERRHVTETVRTAVEEWIQNEEAYLARVAGAEEEGRNGPRPGNP